MLPNSQDESRQDGADRLEDRLRGLILSNANASSNLVRSQQAPAPPQIRPTSSPDQRQLLAATTTHSAPQDSFVGTSQSPHSTKKRPNQAQRRQMHTQQSIPVGTRHGQTAQSEIGRTSFSGYTQASWAPPRYNDAPQAYHNQRYQHQQSYSSHSQNLTSHSPYSSHIRSQQPPPQSSTDQSQLTPKNQLQERNGQHYETANRSNSGPGYYETRPLAQHRQLHQPGPYYGQGRGRPFCHSSDEIASQSARLEMLIQECVPTVAMDSREAIEKEEFRAVVEKACREAIAEYEQQEVRNQMFDASTVELKCFGSMSSGFATKASDMDLALLSPQSQPPPDSSESPIPRLLEKKLLGLGYGARLLTRTRVPIIKLCQKPTEKLLSDLLEERAKWENGFIADSDEEELEAMDVGAIQDNKRPSKDKPLKSPATPKTEIISPQIMDSSEERLLKFKQLENQSLGEYYNATKRLLRRLGGRDVTSNAPELSPEESKLLTSVCKAFICGLASEPLATRLSAYQSITPLFNPLLPFVQRSLNGVWTQVEGERLAMAWDHRQLREASPRHESDCGGLVDAWRLLQDNSGHLTEPLVYNRQLYIAAEKLKKISSLQLVLLEQIQHEDPIYYHGRAQRIFDDLKGPSQQGSSETITPVIVARYVAGIANPQIRKILQNAPVRNATLQYVALQHRVLQLAIDYEHALEAGLYDDADRPDIEQYIALLRNHNFVESLKPSAAPLQSNAEAVLISKIRILPDPTQLSLNKPHDRYRDHLEFPKKDIGIQCDINFSAHLALHNTSLLRCYSHSDPRVKVMVLFVKNWAKIRGINNPYRGTLSSYGYVLMVIHYLVNIAQPFVSPNLQTLRKEATSHLPPLEIDAKMVCNGCNVHFWRNEAEIKSFADRKMLNHNHDTVGLLLRGFFEYFAQNGPMTTVQNRSFDWGREVLSLRTQGGILTKQEKGWVGAKTVVETTTIAPPPAPSTATTTGPQSGNEAYGRIMAAPEIVTVDAKHAKHQTKMIEEVKEVRYRYLFAIEDPFELDHNVARTVTHNGIVSIRDEFRRAWRIIRGVQKDGQVEGLLDPVGSVDERQSGWHALLDLIHGAEARPGQIR